MKKYYIPIYGAIKAIRDLKTTGKFPIKEEHAHVWVLYHVFIPAITLLSVLEYFFNIIH